MGRRLSVGIRVRQRDFLRKLHRLGDASGSQAINERFGGLNRRLHLLGNAAWSLSVSSFVAAHRLGLGEDVGFGGGFEIGAAGSSFEVELGVEGVELEEVAVSSARRRTGASVADCA